MAPGEGRRKRVRGGRATETAITMSVPPEPYSSTHFFSFPNNYGSNRVVARYHLAVHPPVTVSIAGPDSILIADEYEWTANATGGSGTYTYEWQRSTDGGDPWTSVGTSATYVAAVDTGNFVFHLRAIATSAGKADTATHLVVVDATEARLRLQAMTGPTTIEAADTYQWAANPEGGTGSYSYEWFYKVHMFYPKPFPTDLCEEEWYLVGTNQTFSKYVDEGEPDFYLWVRVTSGTQEVSTSKKVYPFESEDPECANFTSGGSGGS